MPDRFSEQPGVRVTIPQYGRTESAPFYEPMYQRLEAAGYVRNLSIFLPNFFVGQVVSDAQVILGHVGDELPLLALGISITEEGKRL